MVDYYPLKRLPGTRKPHDKVVKTICQECAVGCGLLVYLKAGAIIDVQGDEEHPVSKGRLCAKGIAFPQGLNHPNRIVRLAERKEFDAPLEHLDDWEKTLDSLAERLRKIKARSGPCSLMIGCAPDAGLDFHIGALRFARLWGTPHVFHPYHSPRGVTNPAATLSGSVPQCREWVHSGCILLIEADLATTHPVAFNWLLDAQSRGTRIIAVDSRFTPTLSKADMPLQIRPDSGNKVGLALLKTVIEEHLYDTCTAETHPEQPGQWKHAFESLSYDGFEAATGLPVEKVQGLARLLAARKPVTLITGRRLGNRQNSGIWHALAATAGWNGNRAGGWYPLDAGLPPLDFYTDIEARETRSTAADDATESDADGDASPEFVQDSENPVQALICSGNCLYDFLSPLRATAEKAELNIFFGAFPNDTWKMSHTVLPATLWPETDHLSFSDDRAIQWGEKLVEAPAGCRSGLDFWTGLAQRLADVTHLEWKTYFPWKNETGGADHRAFYAWLLKQSTCTAGYDLDELTGNQTGLTVWSMENSTAAPAEPGSIEMIAPGPAPRSFEPPPQSEEAALFPLIVQTTRIISRSGDASNFWPATKDLEDSTSLQINPATAGILRIENGEEVLVHGPGKVIEARVWLSRMVPRGMIWSARRLGIERAVVHKKGESGEDAPQILGEFLQ